MSVSASSLCPQAVCAPKQSVSPSSLCPQAVCVPKQSMPPSSLCPQAVCAPKQSVPPSSLCPQAQENTMPAYLTDSEHMTLLLSAFGTWDRHSDMSYGSQTADGQWQIHILLKKSVNLQYFAKFVSCRKGHQKLHQKHPISTMAGEKILIIKMHHVPIGLWHTSQGLS